MIWALLGYSLGIFTILSLSLEISPTERVIITFIGIFITILTVIETGIRLYRKHKSLQIKNLLDCLKVDQIVKIVPLPDYSHIIHSDIHYYSFRGKDSMWYYFRPVDRVTNEYINTLPDVGIFRYNADRFLIFV